MTPLALVTDAAFRLPGFTGEAIFLQSVVVPDPSTGQARWALDIGLLSVMEFHQYKGGCPGPGFIATAAQFLREAATQPAPEQHVAAVVDDSLGLRVTAVGSTDVTVELQVSVDIEGPESESESGDSCVLDLVTTRAVLAQAAVDIHRLTGREAEPGTPDFVPSDWR